MYCPTRKQRYPFKKGAKEQIRHMLAHGARAGKLRAYRCPICGYWHVGNTNGYPRKAQDRIQLKKYGGAT